MIGNYNAARPNAAKIIALFSSRRRDPERDPVFFACSLLSELNGTKLRGGNPIAFAEGAGKMRRAVEATLFCNSFDGFIDGQKKLLGLPETVGEKIFMGCAVDVFAKTADKMRGAHTAQGSQFIQGDWLAKGLADVPDGWFQSLIGGSTLLRRGQTAEDLRDVQRNEMLIAGDLLRVGEDAFKAAAKAQDDVAREYASALRREKTDVACAAGAVEMKPQKFCAAGAVIAMRLSAVQKGDLILNGSELLSVALEEERAGADIDT